MQGHLPLCIQVVLQFNIILDEQGEEWEMQFNIMPDEWDEGIRDVQFNDMLVKTERWEFNDMPGCGFEG
jgi:hypothetical protein